ncbi:MAG: hypothetical protein H3C34_20085 [Caldilineaceae bacterium]|nr:hypothetical protein [Caldilineaceae bacterium]
MVELTADRLVWVSLAALAVLLLIGWLARRLRRSRRSQELAEAFRISLRSQLNFTYAPSARGFQAHFEPPPEPFDQFNIDYGGPSNRSLLDRFIAGLAASDLLVIYGRLASRPVAEISWERGRIPGRALARRSRGSLWERRRSEILGSEYAVRGADTSALEHVLVDLQARFGPLLEAVTVQAEEPREFQVVLHTGALEAREVPALVITVRALGRAALR